MSKAWSSPVGPRASRTFRVWPPRPKVPSTNTPLGNRATPSSLMHSANMAGVCVPSACMVPVVVATVTSTRRLPSFSRERASASRQACGVLKVTNPRMTRPDTESLISFGPGASISPQPSKKEHTWSSVALGGRYLRKTSKGGVRRVLWAAASWDARDAIIAWSDGFAPAHGVSGAFSAPPVALEHAAAAPSPLFFFLIFLAFLAPPPPSPLSRSIGRGG
mmetsp:Transcript_64906/g.146422  ORF Transcript_64906/g.146422 Transcript_64906/m.146422 type:complete len:220 (-) Transcript_64906:478-1137(-)